MTLLMYLFISSTETLPLLPGCVPLALLAIALAGLDACEVAGTDLEANPIDFRVCAKI